MTPILGIWASAQQPALNATSFESIATVNVGAGGVSGVTFSSIPSTYTHLQLRILGRGANTNAECQFAYQFNGDGGSNYTFHLVRANGSGIFADGIGGTTAAIATVRYAAANASANMFGAGITDILDYSNTSKNKTVRSIGGTDQNGSGQVYYSSNLWMNTSAINSIYIYNSDFGNISQYSQLALYGIKG
jgi:hypothetical protein